MASSERIQDDQTMHGGNLEHARAALQAAPVDLPSVPTHTRRAMRVIDVGVATVTLAVLSPLIVAISVLIKATSAGPAIFRQERVGLGGETFVVLKFRTMADGTHADVLANPELRRRYEENDFKLPMDDERITRIGRWLRKTSLDELPQLVNVFRNEMGLVGVRPIEPDQLALRSEYDRALYCHHKPALTGVWQIAGRSAHRDEKRVELDRTCLERWGIRHNIKILLRTPAVVLLGIGAH